MPTNQKTLLVSHAQAILAQLDAFSKTIKFSSDIVGIEKEELLESLQAPYKNVRYVIRQVNKLNR